MITGLVAGIANSTEGQRWINATSTWIDAVHRQNPPPLSIFTRIYFSNVLRPEVSSSTPFSKTVAGLGNATSTSPQSQLYPAFRALPDYDVVLQKTRYEANFGNSLSEILRSQRIDTVILVSTHSLTHAYIYTPQVSS